VFILGEGLLIYSSVALVSVLFAVTNSPFSEILKQTWLKILLVSLVSQISLYFNDLYDFNSNGGLIDSATRLIQSIGVISIVLAVIYFFWPSAMVGKWIFFASIILLVLFLAFWRLLYGYVLNNSLFSQRVVLVGDGKLANDLLSEIKTRKDIMYDVRALICPNETKTPCETLCNVPLLFGLDKLSTAVESEHASSIIVALDQKRGIMPYDDLLNCRVKGISIIDGETFHERITGKLLVERINPSWLIFSEGFVHSKLTRFGKRLIDVVASTVMLITLAPLMLVVALIIRSESRGPIFFSQERVGESERLFTLYKFRSMREGAEKESGPVWAMDADPRVTRVGRIIRKLRIDELPQLWNVLKGDMSFVGPRPERPFFVKTLKDSIPYYGQRLTVKPGLTGWAQVKYPYGSSEADALEKLKYDLYYIKNLTLIMDLMVIFQTVKTVLLGKGSR
jgi:sugar transferase (PEP-CTERM system associated)